MHKLVWKLYRDSFKDEPLNEEDVSQYPEKSAYAKFGVFKVSLHSGRRYKDGTLQWLVYFTGWPSTSSKEIITLTQARGFLADAIQAAEDFLFAEPYPQSAVDFSWGSWEVNK